MDAATGKRLDFKIKVQQLKAEILEGKNDLEEAATLNLVVIEKATKRRLYPTAYLAYISLSLVQEKAGDLGLVSVICQRLSLYTKDINWIPSTPIWLSSMAKSMNRIGL